LESYCTEGKRQWRFVPPVDSFDLSLSSQPRPPDILLSLAPDAGLSSSVLLLSDVQLANSQPQMIDSPVSPEGAALNNLPSLPEFTPVSEATFTWGATNSQDFCHSLEAMHLSRNCALAK